MKLKTITLDVTSQTKQITCCVITQFLYNSRKCKLIYSGRKQTGVDGRKERLQKCRRELFTPWTVARQAPLSMDFSGILEWLPFPSPGDFPNPGLEPEFPVSPALAGRFSAC